MNTIKLFSLLFSLTCILFVNTSCIKGDESKEPAEPIILTTKQGEKVAADNAFAFNLFREVATSDDKTNAFISPLSVTMALGMLYNGASPDARSEMATALGIQNFSDKEINEYYQTISKSLLHIDPLTQLSIANSIWSEKTFSVKQSFIDINKKYYDAEVQSLDFRLKSTLDAINKWCAIKTNNKIEIILDEIPDDAVMYLINALYFKSKWKNPFDKQNTKNEDFFLENGAHKSVSMMNQTSTFPYYTNDMLQCIEMQYGNEAFSMMVLLPSEAKTVDDVVEYLNHQTWNNIITHLHSSKIFVKIPRFKQECEFSLVDPIKNLGMNLIFQTGGNLNGIADDRLLCVFEIKHKTFVEVNEEGTEAAAVTSIGIEKASMPPSFIANRPFIYLIKEKSTGAILFIGRIDNP